MSHTTPRIFRASRAIGAWITAKIASPRYDFSSRTLQLGWYSRDRNKYFLRCRYTYLLLSLSLLSTGDAENISSAILSLSNKYFNSYARTKNIVFSARHNGERIVFSLHVLPPVRVIGGHTESHVRLNARYIDHHHFFYFPYLYALFPACHSRSVSESQLWNSRRAFLAATS